ncbi:MAG TPA: hypothetical protein PKK99_12835, partial [Bacteroidia bacterium]|nr:hypothetical protein [Bacteroidia bacterium]
RFIPHSLRAKDFGDPSQRLHILRSGVEGLYPAQRGSGDILRSWNSWGAYPAQRGQQEFTILF